MIWICSDWHFNHDKEFVWEARGFKSVDEMNAEIVKRHNLIVAEDDDVYVLGDLCMSGELEINKNFIESMNGKLHIVLGNHCTKLCFLLRCAAERNSLLSFCAHCETSQFELHTETSRSLIRRLLPRLCLLVNYITNSDKCPSIKLTKETYIFC